MAELKTKATKASVDDFLAAIENEQIRTDCYTIAEIMEKTVKAKGCMWGPSIVGFGRRKYKYPDGREMDWMVIAFSPRKKNITLYIATDFAESPDLLSRLGKYSLGKSCLYIKRLSEVDITVLKKIVKASAQHVLKENA